MAEAIFGFLYQVAVTVSGFIARIFSGILGSYVESKVIGSLEEYVNPTKKLEKRIGELQKEKWFADLESDFRYGHIIWNNSRVKEVLMDDKTFPPLLKWPDEQKKFTQLVIEEHRKFVSR